MNKPQRFMTEYASYQKRFLASCDLMDQATRAELIGHIDGAIRAYKHGFITVDETMRFLSLEGLDASTGLRY